MNAAELHATQSEKEEGIIPELCFYCPGERTMIDTADENGISHVNGESIEEMQKRYPTAQLVRLDYAMIQILKARSDKYSTPPEEITEERFFYWLEVLPPLGFVQHRGTTAFMLSEFTEGAWTLHVARVAGKCYAATRRAGTFSISRFIDEIHAIQAQQ
jgi:hypothetical protein